MLHHVLGLLLLLAGLQLFFPALLVLDLLLQKGGIALHAPITFIIALL
jgi:hypothetical protein